ncbi:alpha/beta hydrolase [Streptomyces prasinopilosus]|uniref:Alpha/beta hydrolase n=1 Tax=Streptomyces prasinopilosus TaxID=67344 RepID=A0A1G6MEX8_9ACTN|nr:alpha/beta hydrolase [Streptomyces prasinopilosus]SDC54112.1 Alpha/beta hydrolase [Streptomyces prasinopilosus]
MDLATLRKLEPSEFEGAADGYRAAGDMADTAKDHIERVVVPGMRKSLQGESLEAAVGELRKLSANFHYTQIECGLVSTALSGFAHDLDAARKKLLSALDDAEAASFTVGANGSVSYPEAPSRDGSAPPAQGGTVGGLSDPTAQALARQAANADPNPHHARALAIADRIADALGEATEADAKWAPKIRALKADDDLTVSDEDLEDAQSDMGGVREAGKDYLASIGGPPEDATPRQNADWWKGLTADEREAYLATRPDLVGRLDGLPAEVRDEANRVVFEEKRSEYRLRLDSIPKPPANEWTWITAGPYPSKVHTDEWMEWHRKYGDEHRHLTASLKGMNALQSRFDETGKEGLPEAYLLGFSPEGNGRAVVATGNPDTAQHQAVYVPGTTSNLEKVGGDINRMTELWRRTNQTTPDASVSAITWLGYDAPQSIVKDAPFEHYAYDGAPAYRRFMDGLDASHSGPGEPHRTAIGHSYGTTLIGAAAETGHLNADDVILAGSPGVKVGHADEMDVPRGHVWNQEAEDDPVPDIGRWGHGGSNWSLGGGVFLIPSDEEAFGANQMNTGPEGTGPMATTGATGHSEYWNRGTTALKNQALVVVGEYGDVTAPQ